MPRNMGRERPRPCGNQVRLAYKGNHLLKNVPALPKKKWKALVRGTPAACACVCPRPCPPAAPFIYVHGRRAALGCALLRPLVVRQVNHHSDEFLNERQDLLENYLQRLARLPGIQLVRAFEIFLTSTETPEPSAVRLGVPVRVSAF